MKRVLKYGCAILLVTLVGGSVWLAVAPPELLQVAASYSAKTVCSSAFLSGRDPQAVLEVDVQAPGNRLLRFMRVNVDRETGRVEARLFGLFGKGIAIHRDGFGCTCVPGGDSEAVSALPVVEPATSSTRTPWPLAEGVTNSSLESVLDDGTLVGAGMRAIVVVKDGEIVGERYAEGFDQDMRLLGWSMCKTITSAIIGRLIQEKRITLDSDSLFPSWSDDQRRRITISDLLGMSSGLKWDEGYGSVSDVTRMLYLQPDMAGFVSAARLNDNSGDAIGKEFTYSSGTSVLLSRYWQSLLGSPVEALSFPNRELFRRIGMESAVMEVDAKGTIVGSSYTYATARDWARFGQFLLQKGKWNDQQLLPPGYVDWMITPHPASNGNYGQGHVWISPPNAKPDDPPVPRAFWLSGHDGQSVAVLPDERIVVVRLGLTPAAHDYRPVRLVNAVTEALAE